MKRLMFTMMAVGLLMACVGGSTDTMRRLQQAEDVVEEHPDSAAGLLSQVVTTGMTEEETALYGLLWTMAEFKKHNKDVNDSLVSRSIEKKLGSVLISYIFFYIMHHSNVKRVKMKINRDLFCISPDLY
jgi:hypothetical protein